MKTSAPDDGYRKLSGGSSDEVMIILVIHVLILTCTYLQAYDHYVTVMSRRLKSRQLAVAAKRCRISGKAEIWVTQVEWGRLAGQC